MCKGMEVGSKVSFAEIHRKPCRCEMMRQIHCPAFRGWEIEVGRFDRFGHNLYEAGLYTSSRSNKLRGKGLWHDPRSKSFTVLLPII